jgi:hypothetical protein
MSRKKRKHSTRSSRGYLRRRIETLPTRKQFLIVCEGERTEPNYFWGFRVPKEIIDIRGFGDNTVTLVEQAIELSSHNTYDQVWCVFDRNDFPARDFNDALALAATNNINVAYSNEAFELWYVLHFEFLNTGISRRDYCDKLSKLLGHKYDKKSETIYAELKSRQSDALRNAKRLLQQYNPPNPERDNPSTTVHLLVEQLNAQSIEGM